MQIGPYFEKKIHNFMKFHKNNLTMLNN